MLDEATFVEGDPDALTFGEYLERINAGEFSIAVDREVVGLVDRRGVSAVVARFAHKVTGAFLHFEWDAVVDPDHARQAQAFSRWLWTCYVTACAVVAV